MQTGGPRRVWQPTALESAMTFVKSMERMSVMTSSPHSDHPSGAHTEITGNRAVEDAAIAFVLARETATGRTPRDVRGTGAAGDVDSPPRTIEVKAFGRSARGTDLWLEVRQVEEARHNPDFYVYVVENIRQGNQAAFTLKVIGGARLAGLLSRAREQRYFTLPWPVAEYDATGDD